MKFHSHGLKSLSNILFKLNSVKILAEENEQYKFVGSVEESSQLGWFTYKKRHLSYFVNLRHIKGRALKI